MRALIIGVAVAQMCGCCPDEKHETCMTLAEWRNNACFPEPAEGERCPSAKAFAAACEEDIGSSRVDGDQCCYELPSACL